MDTLEQYIKMCDCPEGQGQWKPQVGDIVYIKNTIQVWSQINLSNASSVSRTNYFIALKNGGHYCILITNGLPNYLKKLVIWLPHQAQIQEMVYENLARADAIVHELNKWREKYYDYQLQFITMEQFSLAFYMHEKHQKVWSFKEGKWLS